MVHSRSPPWSIWRGMCRWCCVKGWAIRHPSASDALQLNRYNPTMDELSVIQRVAVWAIPVLFAITVHEVAHGFVAMRLGDPTAKMLGRLTLNPIKHIDPLGTVVLPLLMLMMGGFIFGWAKPVPVTWENLRHPKRDMALVAAAGPISNLLMALFWALMMRVAINMGPEPGSPLVFLLYVSLAGI